jgi:hypothetical protein
MGLQIGQTVLRRLDAPVSPSSPRPPVQPASQRASDGTAQTRSRLASELTAANPFQIEDRPFSDVGFGRGSISIAAEAVRAIGENLEAAQEVVQSLEETRARIRERIAEVQEQLESTRLEPVAIPRFDVAVGRADTARSVEIELTAFAQPQTPPAAGPRIDIRVGDEALPLERQTQRPGFEFFA